MSCLCAALNWMVVKWDLQIVLLWLTFYSVFQLLRNWVCNDADKLTSQVGLIKTACTFNLGRRDITIATQYDNKTECKFRCVTRLISFCIWVSFPTVSCSKWDMWNSRLMGALNDAVTDKLYDRLWHSSLVHSSTEIMVVWNLKVCCVRTEASLYNVFEKKPLPVQKTDYLHTQYVLVQSVRVVFGSKIVHLN